jgi:hypothetical protein
VLGHVLKIVLTAMRENDQTRYFDTGCGGFLRKRFWRKGIIFKTGCFESHATGMPLISSRLIIHEAFDGQCMGVLREYIALHISSPTVLIWN